jgi:hypothetical protein
MGIYCEHLFEARIPYEMPWVFRIYAHGEVVIKIRVPLMG